MLTWTTLNLERFEQLHRHFSNTNIIHQRLDFYGEPGRDLFGVFWRNVPFAVFCINTHQELLTFRIAGESKDTVRDTLGCTADCVELCALAIDAPFRRTRLAMLVYALALLGAWRTGRRRIVVWTSEARIADTYATGLAPVYWGPLKGREGFWVFAFDRKLALAAWVRAMWRRRLGWRNAPRQQWNIPTS